MAIIHSDFLIIGAGIGGLSCALKAADTGSVTVLCKGELIDSNTSWAQGGISSVLPESLRAKGDSLALHVADTLDAGAGLCKESVVETLVAEGAETIEHLTNYGVSFDKDDTGYDLGKEGGHSKRRILHAKDTTGLEIASSLIEKARQHPNITLLEHHFSIDLITTTQLGATTEDRVVGAYVLDKLADTVRTFRSDRVILATGGCGKVYLYTTNPDSSTGDGLAMAWRAGANIANMEFIQFHPTCFYNPAARGETARSFLVSEAVRGEGGILIDSQGREFMHEYDPRGSLAPRDIVARAIDQEIKKTGENCVYLDVRHKPKGFMKERFPFINEFLLNAGLNPETSPIPVVPAAHYQCGGVETDTNGKTSIAGLFAIGEVACTGFHGANRLASNSLLEANAVARRAFDEMIRLHPLTKNSLLIEEIPPWNYGDLTPPDELVNIYHNWDEVRRTMWDYVSIVRTENRLKRASVRLRNLRNEVKEFYWGYRVNYDILELRNLVNVAALIIDSAKSRKESRGLHYMLDYPNKVTDYKKDTVIRRF